MRENESRPNAAQTTNPAKRSLRLRTKSAAANRMSHKLAVLAEAAQLLAMEEDGVERVNDSTPADVPNHRFLMLVEAAQLSETADARGKAVSESTPAEVMSYSMFMLAEAARVMTNEDEEMTDA
jgi:hypothetical protein